MFFKNIIVITIVYIFLFINQLFAQTDQTRFYRLFLKDKGIPNKILVKGDSLYEIAVSNLTERCLKRRSKTLQKDSIVSTKDLPLKSTYLEEIVKLGAKIAQSSKWFNSVIIDCDSLIFEKIKQLPFINNYITLKTIKRVSSNENIEKYNNTYNNTTVTDPFCLNENYGVCEKQNKMLKVDFAHKLGIAGEGVFIGVLDEGFNPRQHNALKNINIIAEHDFVYNDNIVSDQPDQPSSEKHGTAVTSMIGGFSLNTDKNIIGIAPKAMFALAKTEDSRYERNIEEDNFVAGLEWLESLGVDVTNTSLGYTNFDDPENDHNHDELTGHKAFASIGLNEAVRLGMICVVAAGNEFSTFKYISVPGEADSAIAVAAVNEKGEVAGFSSRGNSSWARIKPEVAAMGVGNCGAAAYSEFEVTCGNGTSYASPCITGVVALILSANPDLRPWEVKKYLFRNSSSFTKPDTAIGYGIVDIEKTFLDIAKDFPLVGRIKLFDDRINQKLIFWTNYLTSDNSDNNCFTLNLKTNFSDTIKLPTCRSFSGLLRWDIDYSIEPKKKFHSLLISNDTFQLNINSTNLNLINNNKSRIIYKLDELFSSFINIKNLPSNSNDIKSSICEELSPSIENEVIEISPNLTNKSCFVFYNVKNQNSQNLCSIHLFNSLGQKVKEILNNSVVPLGYNSTFINFSDFPAGKYFVKFVLNNQEFVKQIVYIPN